MKCPKCGFVSFPELPECRKCGHRFAPSERQEPAPSNNLETSQALGPVAVSDPPERLSERVASFRRRRATLRENDDREMSLAFDFSPAAGPIASSGAVREPSQASPAEQTFDQAFAERTMRAPQVKLESIPLDQHVEESSSRLPSVGFFAENFTSPAARDPHVIQFADAPFNLPNLSAETDFQEVISAPLGSRFAAGLIDILLLLAGGCLFAVVFVAVGGRFDKSPLDMAVVLFIAVFWLFVYFAAFGVMTWRTPGQAAFGLEIRNLNNEPPTVTEALLRAFGYLVSISALTLGFLWAALDSDGMGWHDHISGTVLSGEKRAE